MPARTAALLGPVLHTVTPRDLGQVKHLARLGLHDRLAGQVAPAALAYLDRMQHRPIGILAALEMMTLVAALPAPLAPRRATQTALLVRRLLGIAVRRRGLGGVLRGLVTPRAQLLHQRLELGDPHRLLGDQRVALSQQPLKLAIGRAG